MPNTIDTEASLFAEYLREALGYSPNTVKAYRSDILEFSAFANLDSPKSVVDIDIEMLRGWLWKLAQSGLAKSSLARKSAALRVFTAWLFKTTKF